MIKIGDILKIHNIRVLNNPIGTKCKTLFCRYFGTFVIQVNYILIKIKSTYHIYFHLKRSDQVIGHSKLTHQYLSKGNSNMSEYFVIVLWPYIIYFRSVSTYFPQGTYFLVMYILCKTFFERLISILFCSFCRSVILTRKLKDFYTLLFYIYLIFECPSDKT